MSGKQVGKVYDHLFGKTEQQVALALAEKADHDGTGIRPSIPRLEWMTGISGRTIQRVLTEFRETGFLVIDVPATPTRPNEYSFDWSKREAKPPFKRPETLSPGRRQRFLDAWIEKHGPVCAYCSGHGDAEHGPDGQHWHINRIIPGARGGRYEADNVAIACGTCNRKKGARSDRGAIVTPLRTLAGTSLGVTDSQLGVTDSHNRGDSIVTPDSSLDSPMDSSKPTASEETSEETVKAVPIEQYHTARIYDALKAAKLRLSGKEFAFHLGRVKDMLEKDEPTDQELEKLPEEFVRLYRKRADTDAPKALRELRRNRDRDKPAQVSGEGAAARRKEGYSEFFDDEGTEEVMLKTLRSAFESGGQESLAAAVTGIEQHLRNWPGLTSEMLHRAAEEIRQGA